MGRTIRLGLVGIGEMAELHAVAARSVGIELTIAAGRTPERARDLGSRLGVPIADSFAAVLADPSVTAVDLCVPNDVHRAYAEQAFAAGKHVLCEKPIALTLDDADAMIAAARRAGRILMVGHVLRFWPEYRQVRALYQAGDLGEARWFAARRLTGVLAATQGVAGWRSDPARSGGAALDLQIHDLDFICWLFGAPQSVYSYGVRSASGSWDHVVTTLRYADGRGASVEASFLLPGDPLEIGFRLLTDRASVLYRYAPRNFALHGLHGEETEGAPSLMLYAAGRDPRPLAQPAQDSFTTALAAELATFAEGIRTGQAPAAEAGEARLALAVALASLQSCETGRPVEGPF